MASATRPTIKSSLRMGISSLAGLAIRVRPVVGKPLRLTSVAAD